LRQVQRQDFYTRSTVFFNRISSLQTFAALASKTHFGSFVSPPVRCTHEMWWMHIQLALASDETYPRRQSMAAFGAFRNAF
jgi:hypothetical protein